MTVSAIGNNLMTNSSSNLIKEGKGSDKLYRDDFMLMLIEQIKNQDPLSPMENTEFTAQLAQFSALEGITNLNETMNSVLMAQTSLSNASAVNLIGKKVQVQGNTFELKEEGATLSYILPREAQHVNISVFNQDDVKITSFESAGKSIGTNSVEWDGLDRLGTRHTNGQYTFSVKAIGTEEEEIEAHELSLGEVTHLTFEQDGTYLTVNNKKVPMGAVSSVSKE